jgi:hypothetical protein
MKLFSHPKKRGWRKRKRKGITPLSDSNTQPPPDQRIYGDDQEKICLNSVQ